jgi:hypothetical protein
MSIIYFRSLYQAILISNGNKEMCFAEPLNNVNEHFCAVFISVFERSKLRASTGGRIRDCSTDIYIQDMSCRRLNIPEGRKIPVKQGLFVSIEREEETWTSTGEEETT